ncbi:EAL domain-containing protein, partial [Burkholderia ambifaria]
AEREWLFLNVHPGVLTDPFQAAALLANLKRLDISPRRVVLEVLEQRADDLDRLADAVHDFREHGFLIALDDFGAGHSNIERIWQLNPDIVKLDRIMLSHAQHRSGQLAILHGLVTLLHEAGKLVLIEGIETEHDAQVALACEADFVQGYFFGRPAPGLSDGVTASACIGELT